MRAARKVIFPATPRPDWELWGYRLLLLAGSVAWYVAANPERAQCWWREWRWLPICGLTPLVTILWIAIRRPGWPAAVVGLTLAGLCWMILFPVFFKGCGCGGRQSSCTSNLKQIAIASLQYAHDHDDRWPPMEVRWTEALKPYTKNEQISRCPGSDRHPMPRWDPADPGPVTYSLNPYLRSRKLSEVPRPAEVILAWCGDAAGPVMRHNEGCNYAYADGHVKWIKAGQDPGIWDPWELAP